ncbi:MAG: glycosyltransferase family 4 protein [Caldibacillus debilis]|uniref:Glycosyltransferase family 4 protein n=1 Tax=Caldibacillus debilis TaxID=301148 RepID=A0A3E0K4R1_9BACI|nr:glycosyltransferase family 4 protein [Caldibacillus debilis]OUM93292.1 MAG: UDP-glucose--polyglycerol phosphate glucosyltransferase [Caldibacillus debilis]REJ17223.1 MAG: glycosyltransferase family 4 protein [Caldibacillus debilis]REJ27672.1 MAG: glycosyltransferase family 4 protein [Caldibacillus debilis]REJ28359.1 MAG: glycosyltransferase family 4 protein [Caldibacillus debilis]
MSKIYILLFDIYGVGGTVRTIVNTANFLAKQGYDVEIVSVFRYQKDMFFPLNPNVKVSVLNSRLKSAVKNRNLAIRLLDRSNSIFIHPDDEAYKFFSLVTDIKLIKWIKSIRNSVIITTRPSFNILAAKYAHPSNILIGQEHLNFSIYPDKLKKAILKYYPKLDYLLTLTDKDTTRYKQLFNNKNVQVRKIPNSLPPLKKVKSSLNEKIIISAGRLVPQKGYDLLIQAFTLIKDKHPDWIIKIFGKGRDKSFLEELIHETETYNNIFILPPTPNIEEEFARSSIFALSSRYEGFGMVLVEAMAVGLPIVSFDCPEGPGEIITNNEDGFLVEEGNIEEFANKLDILMSNQELRIKMGNAALKNVERFSIEVIGKLWLQLLDDIGITLK